CYSETNVRMLSVLAIGFVLSRALSGLAIVSFRMAKNTGLAATFSDMAVKNRVKTVMILYILLCAVGMILLEPVLGTVCFISALLMFAYYRRMSYQKFGGITGDLAGFFLQVCELVMAAAVVITAKIIGL
ncbi:adenosylcobinamide-GDP ribazoletransferase, partial [Robinsoniella sp.]